MVYEIECFIDDKLLKIKDLRAYQMHTLQKRCLYDFNTLTIGDIEKNCKSFVFNGLQNKTLSLLFSIVYKHYFHKSVLRRFSVPKGYMTRLFDQNGSEQP